MLKMVKLTSGGKDVVVSGQNVVLLLHELVVGWQRNLLRLGLGLGLGLRLTGRFCSRSQRVFHTPRDPSESSWGVDESHLNSSYKYKNRASVVDRSTNDDPKELLTSFVDSDENTHKHLSQLLT